MEFAPESFGRTDVRLNHKEKPKDELDLAMDEAIKDLNENITDAARRKEKPKNTLDAMVDSAFKDLENDIFGSASSVQSQVEHAVPSNLSFEKFDEKTGKDVNGNYYTSEMYTADLKQVKDIFDKQRQRIDEKIRSLFEQQKIERSPVSILESAVDRLFDERTKTVEDQVTFGQKLLHVVDRATRSQGEENINLFFASIKK